MTSLKFSPEEISKISQDIESKELITDDQKEILVNSLKTASSSNINLGRLVARCYNLTLLIYTNISDLELFDKVKLYLNTLEREFDVTELETLVSNVDSTEGGIGSHHYSELLNDLVRKYKNDYLEFLDFFLKVGGIND